MSVANRFSMPGTDYAGDNRHVDANPPFWYSYEYGSVHFTVISTEHSLEQGSDQYKVGKPRIGHLSAWDTHLLQPVSGVSMRRLQLRRVCMSSTLPGRPCISSAPLARTFSGNGMWGVLVPRLLPEVRLRRLRACVSHAAVSSDGCAPMALQWLERDFRRVDRCTTPWLVVAMHRPMYVVYPHKANRIVAGQSCCPCAI